jgi:hypothetical protein
VGAAPAVEATAAASARGEGACVALKPTGPGASVDLTLPAGRYQINPDGGASLQLRRLATTFPAPGALNGPSQLALPRDRLADPWHARIALQQPVRVCTLGG